MCAQSIESESLSAESAELKAVLSSEQFVRAPALANLLSYLCQKAFTGEADRIKEYSIAVDVFGRPADFDQDSDSIVRVQANRLRKRLAEYYAGEGAGHLLQISIPIGQYAPLFIAKSEDAIAQPGLETEANSPRIAGTRRSLALPRWVAAVGIVAILALLAGVVLMTLRQVDQRRPVPMPQPATTSPETRVTVPVGDEVRILSGSNRSYVDRAGKTWIADRYYSGGAPVRTSVQQVWRTQDPEMYRTSRQGDFAYDIPLKPGTYELRLHFAETSYGPEGLGGGEGSRVMSVAANDKPLLTEFDAVADAGGSRTADVRVFPDVSPAPDGVLHLAFRSIHGARSMLSAIEIVPGQRGRMRPVRIVARDAPYYSNDSQWWAPDNYFKGGQLAVRVSSLEGTDDPEFYESERWGNFSYAIPVAPGRYTASLHFVERRLGTGNRDKYLGPPPPSGDVGARVFSVFCNGKVVLHDLDIYKEAGENRPLIKRISGLESNAQGKLVLEFIPRKDYATVSAIEIQPE